MKRVLAASAAWLVFTAVAAPLVAPLAAQQIPYFGSEIPLVPGTTRDPQAEAEWRAERGDSGTRFVRAYRIGASVEALFRWYQNRLGGEPNDGSDSTPPPMRAGLTNITYQVGFHGFEDRCADPPGPVAAGVPCRKVLQGRTKRSSLSNVRIPYEKDHWIEDVTFSWFRRDTTGALTRLRVVIHDIGLAPDWKHYTPLGRLVLVSDVVEEGRPGMPPTKP